LSIESKKIKARLNHCSAREVEEGEKKRLENRLFFSRNSKETQGVLRKEES